MAALPKIETPAVEVANPLYAPRRDDMDRATAGMSDEERDLYFKEIERIGAARGATAAFGARRQKLALPVRPGYKRHWFNDDPGRIEDALANGWAHVKDKSKKEVKRIVGSGRQGGPQLAYAMEIPMVFWMQDKRRRNQEAQDRMDMVKNAPISAPAGMAKRSDQNAFYSPRQEALSIRETGPIGVRPEKV